MSNVIELSRPVKPAPCKRVFGWIVKIDGQRAQIPATFPQILRLMPSILGGNPKREAV